MAEDLHDIDRVSARLAAVNSVGQVVHGLWAVARAQAPEADRAAAESETYLERVRRVIDRLSAPASEPIVTERVLHVVMGPERGFCGALARRMVDAVPSQGPIALVGRWMGEFVSESPRTSERVLLRLSGPVSADEIGGVAGELTGALASRAADWDIMLHFPVARTQSAHSVMLLESGRTIRDPAPETWSPPEAVLEAALAEWLAGRLAAALSETFRAEVHSRMAAADSARKNCDRHAGELERTLRALRQDQITGEILDLVAGRLLDEGASG